jgi:hypothetical protein
MVLNVHQAPQGGMRIADQLADEGFVAGSHGGADFIYTSITAEYLFL